MVDRTLFVGLPLVSDVVAVCDSTEDGEGVTGSVQERKRIMITVNTSKNVEKNKTKTD